MSKKNEKKQPAHGVSGNPGDTVSITPMGGHRGSLKENEGAQVAGDESSNGHYESLDGQLKWIGQAAKEGRIAPNAMNDHVEPEPNDRAFPNRIEVEDGTTLGRHTK